MEKLAVFKSVDEIIQLDEEIRPGEVRFMEELCESLGFEKAMLREARRVDAAEALAVLKAMPEPQKQALARILNKAANAVSPNEIYTKFGWVFFMCSMVY